MLRNPNGYLKHSMALFLRSLLCSRTAAGVSHPGPNHSLSLPALGAPVQPTPPSVLGARQEKEERLWGGGGVVQAGPANMGRGLT